MADYSRISPATITNWSAVITDPTTNEQANLLWQAILQTRQFVYDFLDAKFDRTASDVLKPATIAATSLLAKVNGSTTNTGTQREIVQGTVGTIDLRDVAVTAAKIASDAVTTVKIADGQVTTGKVNDGAITMAKITDAQVTTAKIANDAVDADKLKDDPSGATGAVTTDHIRSLAVSTAKLAANAVTGAKLLSGTTAQLLIASAGGEFTPQTMSGAATITAGGVVSLAISGYSSAVETVGSGTSAGAAVATTWNLRGNAIAWTEVTDTVNQMSIGTGGAIGQCTLTAGTYLVKASAPAYKVDTHMLRLRRFNVSAVLQETVYGTSEKAAAADTSQTRSHLWCRMTFASGDYVQLEHYTTAAEATDGLGIAAAIATIPEGFAQIEFHRSE